MRMDGRSELLRSPMGFERALRSVRHQLRSMKHPILVCSRLPTEP
jgi:uncharacterized protein (DUF934 family)